MLVVAVGVGLSGTVNPMRGRTVHWDWTAALASTLFVAPTVAVRRRWL